MTQLPLLRLSVKRPAQSFLCHVQACRNVPPKDGRIAHRSPRISGIRSQHTIPNNYSGRPIPTMKELGLREGDHVTVGMSGGVDSATTLRILREFPIDIDVVFMRNWDPLLSESSPETNNSPVSYHYSSKSSSPNSSNQPNLSPCQWQRDWDDVLRVSTHIGIPKERIKLVDLSQEYWSRVFEPAVGVWERGGTPNPDVDCNREIKFGALLNVLPKGDRHFLATGHYGRISHPSDPSSGPSRLLRAVDQSKDQTYYLSQMSEYQLSRSILPLGGLPKSDVRQLASHWNLPNAEKEESMGVCFIGERGKFGDFISQYTSPPPLGYLISPSGERIMPHKGLWYYTIGQRARIPSQSQAMFVAKKGVGESGLDIMVVPGSDHPLLKCTSIHISNFFWIHTRFPRELLEQDGGRHVQIQVRHRMTPVNGRVILGDDGRAVRIDLVLPLVGVSPGQVAGIWYDEWCLGSGVIEDTTCQEA